MSIQERMLWEISNSSQKYLEEKEERGETVERNRPLKKYRPDTGDDDSGGSLDFQVGALDELRDEDEFGNPVNEVARAADESSEEEVHNLSGSGSGAIELYEPPDATSLTYAAFGLWCLLVLAVIASFVLKVSA
jgi:hypothetical protein